MSAVCIKVKGRKNTQAPAAAKTYNQNEIVGLIKKAADGNFAAFGELYSIYLDRIYRYVYYQINDRMTAEDITEEVFIKAWKAIGSCKGKEKTFSSWLYRIAHNHLINTLRFSQRFTILKEDSSTEIIDPRKEIEAKIEYRELIETLTCLPANYRQVIILKFIEGLNNQETGIIMGKSEGAVRVLQMRALAALKQKLGDENEK